MPRVPRHCLSFLYDLKGESIIDSTYAALGAFRCVDTPSEAVIAVVGNHMGVVAVGYNITCFCTSEGICGVASATDGVGS